MDVSKQESLARILADRKRRGVLKNDAALHAPSGRYDPPPTTTPPREAPPPVHRAAASPTAPLPTHSRTRADELFMQRIGHAVGHAPAPTPAAPVHEPPSARGASFGRASSVDATSRALVPVANQPEPTGAEAMPQLFVRGRFDTFRERPILYSPNILPYRHGSQTTAYPVRSASPPAAGGTVHRGAKGASFAASGRERIGSAALAAPAAAPDGQPVTMPNPFRVQPFEAFAVSPDYATPEDVKQLLSATTVRECEARNHNQQKLVHAFHRFPSPSRPNGAPVYELNEAVRALQQGDWFYKWTRRKDKSHRRFFWLHPDGWLLWAKAPHVNTLVASKIRIDEIVALEPHDIPDPESGRTFFVLVLWTLSRTAQIGTEKREKFNLWFDTLLRLSQRHRERNRAFYTRHATMQPVKGRPQPKAGPSD